MRLSGDTTVRTALVLARAVVCAVCLVGVETVALAHEPGEEAEAPERTAPGLLERIEPVYPEQARKDGIGGTVSLEITVAADGTVEAVRVTRGAGFGFDEAALAAARRFRFKPATEHGKPIASVVLFDQRFVVRPHLSAEASAEPPSLAPPPAPPPAGPPPPYRSTVVGRGPDRSASAWSIPNDDFDLRPLSAPGDLLQVVPGLLAEQPQGGGKAQQLFLRGFDADHGTDVGVFLDGIPINLPSHAHGQGYADLNFIVPEAIERIDVYKGPYDVRWGDFSTAGAINLTTRSRFDASSVQLTVGGFPGLGCRRLDANITGGATDCKVLANERVVAIASPRLTGWAEKLHAFAAFEGAHDDGPFASPERLFRYSLFAKVSYEPSPATSIGLFFQSYGSQWVGSGLIPAREVAAGRLGQLGSLDPSEGGMTERQMVTGFLRHRSADSELNATAWVTRYRLSLWNDFTFYLNDPVHGSELEQDDSRTASGLRVEYHFHRHRGGISFRTTLGAEARYDQVHADRWDAESCSVNGTPPDDCPGGDFRRRLGRHLDPANPAWSGSDDDVTQLDVAGFIEEDVVWNRYLRVIAGLRSDYLGFNLSGGSDASGSPAGSGTAQKALLSPKLSAIVSPVPGVLDVYLNYGMGFHSNSAQVAVGDGQRGHAVPQLHGGEVGARLRLWRRVELAGALWMSYLQSETVFDADAGEFVPADPTLRFGFDVDARVRILDWLFADFDLAQASATFQGGSRGAVPLVPRLYFTAGIGVQHRVGVRAGLRLRYLGERPAFDDASAEYRYFTSRTLPDGTSNPDHDPSRVVAAGYAVLDLYGAYRYRWFEVGLAIQNLLNSSWREAQVGSHSCTRDETYGHPGFAGRQLADGTFTDRCDIALGGSRTGVTDVHFTSGVPFALHLTLKAYF